MSTTDWRMPKPQIGDTVLFSKDQTGFTNPTVGWVMSKPGDSTVSVVTFTPTGYAFVYNSCHHKDDPRLKEEHGWQDLGVWDFAPMTKAVYAASESKNKSEPAAKVK